MSTVKELVERSNEEWLRELSARPITMGASYPFPVDTPCLAELLADPDVEEFDFYKDLVVFYDLNFRHVRSPLRRSFRCLNPFRSLPFALFCSLFF